MQWPRPVDEMPLRPTIPMPNFPRVQRVSAFTLVELLVVIAIIAVLAAILFPVFARARENARRSSCQSNLKQLGLGVIQYTQDYDEYLPMVQQGTGSTTKMWPTLIQPYIKSSQVFKCPSGERPAIAPDPQFIDSAQGAGRTAYCGVVTGDGSADSLLIGTNLSYTWNAISDQGTSWNRTNSTWGSLNSSGNPYTSGTHLVKSGFISGDKTSIPLHIASIGDAAGSIHIFDGVAGGSNPGTASACTPNSLIRIDDEEKTDMFKHSETSKPSYRHFDGFNVLFGDGHVKFRKYGTTKATEWTVQED